MSISLTTLLGGGMIFGFSAFADKLTKLQGTPFTTGSVSSVFAIGHNITAWGCILSGLILDRYGPRFCAFTGLVIEAAGHFCMLYVTAWPRWVVYVAYGMLGVGGCQVLFASLTFVDAFPNAALRNTLMTACFQAGGFVFMVLPFVSWGFFFTFYTGFCLLGALLVVLSFPDSPLPAYRAQESSEIDDLSQAIVNRRSLRSIVTRPGTIWFLLTFMIGGSALMYGNGEFIAAVESKDGTCKWNPQGGRFVACESRGLQDLYNNVMMPLVGNFIFPASLILGSLIDRTGFALPAFLNIACVQGYIAALWLLPLRGQFATLVLNNFATSAVFAIQNAYICAVGHSHIGALFSISNFVLGAGNLVADWLTMNPFGSGRHAVEISLTISCIGWLLACTPLYYWVFVEVGSSMRRRTNLASYAASRESSVCGTGAHTPVETPSPQDVSDGVSSPPPSATPLLRSGDLEANRTAVVVDALRRTERNGSEGTSLDAGGAVLPQIAWSPVVTVHPPSWEAKVQALLNAGRDSTFFVFDFDNTVTRCYLEDGNRSLDSHNILASIPKITLKCKRMMEDLMGKYYPIEIDPTLTIEEKIPYMIEWYDLVNGLLGEQGLTRDDVATAVKCCDRLRLRPGVEEAFGLAARKGIPVIIISAGLGNVIEEVIRQRIPAIANTTGEPWPNVRVLSNMLSWTEEGLFSGFSDPLIHMYNKSLRDAPDGVRKMIEGRQFGILCGDGIGDLTMADGHDTTTVLKVGFLNERVEERLPQFIGADRYDRVVLDDGTFEPLLEVLRRL